jgi:hypothetical protein
MTTKDKQTIGEIIGLLPLLADQLAAIVVRAGKREVAAAIREAVEERWSFSSCPWEQHIVEAFLARFSEL